MEEKEVHGERLARVEEQTKGIREDLTDFRTEMRNMWSSMLAQSVTHNELDSKLALRDQRLDNLEDAQKSSISRRNLLWITLVGAAAGAILTGIVSVLILLLHK